MTRIEAAELLREYSYLKGSSSLKGDIIRKVECVAIAPFDEMEKWCFFNSYLETRNAVDALAGYNDDEFDLLVIFVDLAADGHIDYSYQSLVDYLEEKGEQPQVSFAGRIRRELENSIAAASSSTRYWNSLA